jgi:hypothetical protein
VKGGDPASRWLVAGGWWLVAGGWWLVSRDDGNWWREKAERDSIFALDFLQK